MTGMDRREDALAAATGKDTCDRPRYGVDDAVGAASMD